jgi:hypothetical protein
MSFLIFSSRKQAAKNNVLIWTDQSRLMNLQLIIAKNILFRI